MRVSFLGLGSWALALATTLEDNGHEILMWSALEDEVNEFNQEHRASKYFTDLKFSNKILATSDLQIAIDYSEAIIIAIPTKFYREVLVNINSVLTDKKLFVNVSKGIEPKTFELMSDIIYEVINNDYIKDVINLSGPSHAEELVLKMETTLVSASSSFDSATFVQDLFSNNYLRVYKTNDLKGTQLVGALKNIIAIAAGALAGLDKGDNVRAALITRGLEEIRRYALYRGASEKTVYGLAGLGDLIVTTSSKHSRNFQAGYRIGKGESPQKSIENSVMVVEGIRTCKAVVEQIKNIDLDMPITEAVYAVFYENKSIDDMMLSLMTKSHRNDSLEDFYEKY